MKKWIIILLLVFVMITQTMAQETEKPVIVFLPGLACPPDTFAPLIVALQPDYDCRQLSWTEWWNASDRKLKTTDKLTQQVISFLNNLKKSDIILVGHSMGGWLALSVAADLPGKISKLVIVDAAPFPGGLYQDITPEQAAAQAAQLDDYLNQMSDEQYRAFDRQRMSMLIENESWREQLINWSVRYSRSGIIGLMSSMAASDLRPKLPRIQAETLVVASGKIAGHFGVSRQAFFDRLQEQYRTLENCRIILAEKAGHFIMIDEVDWFESTLKSFLAFR